MSHCCQTGYRSASCPIPGFAAFIVFSFCLFRHELHQPQRERLKGVQRLSHDSKLSLADAVSNDIGLVLICSL